jgi:hypothetical protein
VPAIKNGDLDLGATAGAVGAVVGGRTGAALGIASGITSTVNTFTLPKRIYRVLP